MQKSLAFIVVNWDHQDFMDGWMQLYIDQVHWEMRSRAEKVGFLFAVHVRNYLSMSHNWGSLLHFSC